MWVVYIILCQGNSLYTGITNNLEKRFQDHLKGAGASYTRSHKPIKIVYSEALPSHSEALKREFEIKKLKKAQKLELIKQL